MISIHRALKSTLKEAVTTREIAKYASEYGYVDTPIDSKVVHNVKETIRHIRLSGGQIKVENEENGPGRKYRYKLTQSGREYIEWLKNHYKEKVGRFPPREV
jgi:hypothetical protein